MFEKTINIPARSYAFNMKDQGRNDEGQLGVGDVGNIDDLSGMNKPYILVDFLD